MKLTILGCGTSTGVPVPGCDCSVCRSSNPKNYRLRTSGLITLPSGENILIDAGPDLRQQALKNNIDRIDAVLYTHAHSDHILGTDDLRCFNFKRPDAIPCYAESHTLNEVKRVFRYLFEDNSAYEGGLLAKLSLVGVSPLKPFNLFGQTVTPFRLWHGQTMVTGYKIGSLVYATDCNLIPEDSKTIVSNPKVLVLDALRYRSHKTHFTIDQSINVAKELNSEMTYFVHMTHDIDYETDSASLPKNIFYAHDGLTIRID